MPVGPDPQGRAVNITSERSDPRTPSSLCPLPAPEARKLLIRHSIARSNLHHGTGPDPFSGTMPSKARPGSLEPHDAQAVASRCGAERSEAPSASSRGGSRAPPRRASGYPIKRARRCPVGASEGSLAHSTHLPEPLSAGPAPKGQGPPPRAPAAPPMHRSTGS